MKEFEVVQDLFIQLRVRHVIKTILIFLFFGFMLFLVHLAAFLSVSITNGKQLIKCLFCLLLLFNLPRRVLFCAL